MVNFKFSVCLRDFNLEKNTQFLYSQLARQSIYDVSGLASIDHLISSKQKYEIFDKPDPLV